MSSSHLDLDALADLLAGEGSEADVAHVGTCSGCAGRLDELAAADAEVASALAALPVPVLPDGLAERLERALAAEPPLTPSSDLPDWARTGPDGSPDPDADADTDTDAGTERQAARTVTPFPAARTRRWAPVAAAAALLVAAGTVGGGLLLAGRDDRSTDSLAGGAETAQAPAFGDLPTSSTGRDYAADGSLAAALPDLLQGDAALDAAAAPLSAGPPSAPRESGAGGDDAEGAGGGSDAGSDAGSAVSDDRAAGTADPLDRLRDPAELASCLTALLPPDDPSAEPVALDYAAYAGVPALVVVLPAQDAPDKVDVFVVGAECRQGDDRTLFFTRLDRP